MIQIPLPLASLGSNDYFWFGVWRTGFHHGSALRFQSTGNDIHDGLLQGVKRLGIHWFSAVSQGGAVPLPDGRGSVCVGVWLVVSR